jgi:hypothetical protein
MSDRERWVVYPLLFLALGMAMFDGLRFQAEQQTKKVETKSPEFESIRCKELRVIDENGQLRVALGESAKQNVGLITVHNTDGKPVVRLTADEKGGAGIIETASSNGTPQIVLTSNANTAVIGMYDRGRLIPLAPADVISQPPPSNQKPQRPEPHEGQSPDNR